MSRTIYRNSEIIISDEPTAALAPKANMSSIACLISYFVVKPVYIFHIVYAHIIVCIYLLFVTHRG